MYRNVVPYLEKQASLNLIQNKTAVQKYAAPKKAIVKKKRCGIQGGGQEMAVMVG